MVRHISSESGGNVSVMKFYDVYGECHKTPFGAMRVGIRHAVAKKVKKAAERILDSTEERNYDLYVGAGWEDSSKQE